MLHSGTEIIDMMRKDVVVFVWSALAVLVTSSGGKTPLEVTNIAIKVETMHSVPSIRGAMIIGAILGQIQRTQLPVCGRNCGETNVGICTSRVVCGVTQVLSL